MSYLHNSNQFLGDIEYLNISDIEPPLNILRIQGNNDLSNLSNSIKQHGLIQPIVVRPIYGHFEIVAGCRRYMACKSLNWKKIPCHTVHLNDIQTFEMALVENIQRESLSALEEAESFKMYVLDKGWGSISDLSFKIGKSPSYITKRISLLDLPPDVKQSIEKAELKPSSAEELLAIKDPERQSQLAEMILKRRLTTMKARELVREDPYYCENSEIIEVRSELQAFNKSIVILKIAMNKMAQLIDEEDERYEQDEKERKNNKNTIESDNNHINDEKNKLKENIIETTNKNKTKNNFLIKELLMYEKRQLHDQIGMLMKAKKKYAKNIFRYRRIMDR